MKIALYKDKKGQWRWRIVARNGKVLADSAEGYLRRAHALRMAQKISTGVELEVVVLD